MQISIKAHFDKQQRGKQEVLETPVLKVSRGSLKLLR